MLSLIQLELCAFFSPPFLVWKVRHLYAYSLLLIFEITPGILIQKLISILSCSLKYKNVREN